MHTTTSVEPNNLQTNRWDRVRIKQLYATCTVAEWHICPEQPRRPDLIQEAFRFSRASLLKGSLGLLPRGERGEPRSRVELRSAEEVLQELRAARRRAHVTKHRGAPADGGGDVGPRAAAAEAPAGVHDDARGREAR